MSLIRNIRINMSADAISFIQPMEKATATLETFQKSLDQTQSKVSSLDLSKVKAPSSAVPAAPAAGEGAGGPGADTGALATLGIGSVEAVTSAIGAITSGIATATVGIANMVSAMAPLTTLASTVTAQMEVMGAKVMAVMNKIYLQSKMGAFEQIMTSISAHIQQTVQFAANNQAAALTRLQRLTIALGPAVDRAITAYNMFNRVVTVFEHVSDAISRLKALVSGVKFDKPITEAQKLNNAFKFQQQAADAQKLTKGIESVAPAASKAATSVKALGVQIALALGLVGVIYKATSAVVNFFKTGISGASDLNETISKTETVFGKATSGMVAQADNLAKSFGLPKGAILDAASSFGLIGKGVGQTTEQAANMSKVMVQLAADASSLHNVPLDVSLEKIRAGLTGESEPLKAFGVIMNEDIVKARGLALGLVKVGQEMNEQAKVAARASIISEKLGVVSGDLEKTQGGMANQWRKLTGGIENFATSIGELLLPALTDGVVVFNEFFVSVVQGFESFKPLISSWVEYFKAGIQEVGLIIRNIGDYWELATISVTQQVGNMMAVFNTIPANLGLIANYVVGNWKDVILDGVNAVQSIFQNLGHNIGEYLFAAFNALSTGQWVAPMTKPLLEGFKATAAALPDFVKPAFVDMSKEMDDVLKRIEVKERHRDWDAITKVPGVADKLGPLGGAAAKKDKKGGKEDKGAGALEFGSQEAGSAVAKFMNQVPDDKPAKETAAATKETALHTKSTAQALREIAARTAAQAVGLGGFPI